MVPVQNFDISGSNGPIHVVSMSQNIKYRLASRTSRPRLVMTQFSDDKKTDFCETAKIRKVLGTVIMDLRHRNHV